MKYWAYINNEILGPFEKEKLSELPNFGASSLICPQTPVGEKTEDWKEASTYPEVSAMLNFSASGALKSRSPSAEPAGNFAAQLTPPPTLRPEGPAEAGQAPHFGPVGKSEGQAGGGVKSPSLPQSTPAFGMTMRGSLVPDPLSTAPEEQPAVPGAGEIQRSDGRSISGLPAQEESRAATAPEAVKLKPLAASSFEPAAPPPSSLENMNIEVSHFGALKSDGKIEHPVTELARNASASFDPLTLSQIGKRADAISAEEQAPPPAEIKNSEELFKNFKPAADISFGASVAEPPKEVPAAADQAGGETFPSKTHTFDENTLTRQELNSQLEPLKQKLEQMGTVLASIDNSQFQRDLLGRLSLLESEISDIKISLSSGTRQDGVSLAPGGNFAPAQENQTVTIEKNSDSVFGVGKPPAQENAKTEESKKEEKKPAIVDTGRKKIRIGSFFGKLFRLITTLLLIAAIALVAVFVLKQQKIFDATKYIPFPIPFLTNHNANTKMAVQDAQTAQFPTGQDQAPQGAEGPNLSTGTEGANLNTDAEHTQGDTAQKQTSQAKVEAVPPEVIYFIRNYTLRPGGLTLENAIRQEAAKAGWDSEKLEWEGNFTGTEGYYQISAVVPSKNGKSQLAFTYKANVKRNDVKPLDTTGNAGMEALVAASASKKQPKARAAKNKRQAKPVRTHATTPKQHLQAAQKQAAPADEYEYVDEEDTGK
ncbi:MAG: hypothetical protein NTX59_03285 [Elusimicrobia bacterium]|nr:hypothetical protein [Elusimicrobiota bacterium]